MDPTTLATVMTTLGYGAYVPVFLAVIGLFSAIAVVYPPTAPGAYLVHKMALLFGKAAPAAPAATSPTVGKAIGIIAALSAALGLSACTATQTASVEAQGQLYCAVATASGPLVSAVVDAADARAVVATGKGAATVANICAVIGGIPVSPPAGVSPVVAVKMPG